VLLGLAYVCGRYAVSAGRDAAVGVVDVSRGVELITVAGAGLVATWLALLLLLGAGAALPGSCLAPARTVAARLAPRAAPRIATALLAAAAVLAPVGSAHAHTAAVAPGAAVAAVPAALDRQMGAAEPVAPDPGWLPTGPRPAPDRATVGPVARPSARDDSVVVRPGDTLWGIAARQLGTGADAATVAATWPLWFEANRGAIGPDPDLILPGTRLRPPGQEPAEQQAQGDPQQVAP
jgi:nucleoid-associated protein YgaU